MQCPNCGSQIPDNSSKCRVCGVSLSTSSLPAKSGMPKWAKGLLIGGGIGAIGLVILALLGVAYYFFKVKPSQQVVSEPMPAVVVTIEPPTPYIPPPTVTDVVLATPLPLQTSTLATTLTPTETPTLTPEPQFCNAFDGIKMSVVYMDWKSNKPLEFYVKMPGGVPGLEKKVAGASEEWIYRVEIGDYRSSKCDIIAGYKERLYCEITLPSEYESSVHPMAVYANQCDKNVFSGRDAFLPAIKK